MSNYKKPILVIIGIIAIIAVVGTFFGFSNQPVLKENTTYNEIITVEQTLPSEKIQVNWTNPLSPISIDAVSPEIPSPIPLYQGILYDGDTIEKEFQPLVTQHKNVISEIEAPAVAGEFLKSYGGLPPDAILSLNSTSYIEIYNHSSGTVESRRPVFTTVSYGRWINSTPVYGRSDFIALDIGANGELLNIEKRWRTLEYSGRWISIIPASEAAKKLQRGEVLNQPRLFRENVLIHDVFFAFYEKSDTDPLIDIEPIWVFAGETSRGSGIAYYVYARKFANFTVKSSDVDQTEKFYDASDASPVRWYWEFGDGTNTSVQNPTHRFERNGNYIVNLTVWNDLGSDTISQKLLINNAGASDNNALTSQNRENNRNTSNNRVSGA